MDALIDAYRKKPKRTMQFIAPIPIVIILYVLHTFLPSFTSAGAITIVHFNLVMAVVTLDLMLCNMASKPFMALNPALLLLVVPLVAFFGFKVEP